MRSYSTSEMNKPSRSFNCSNRKRLNGMLLSSNQLNVLRGMNASQLSRKAITSYLRGSVFNTEPSPNQPPVSKPVKVTVFPSGDTLLIFNKPSDTPIQWSTG